MTALRALGFILPAVAVAVAFSINPCEEEWYVYLIVLAAAETAVYFIFEGMNRDVEFLSGYYTEVRHYYPWVEKVTTTRTESDGKGNTRTVTETHYVNHPDTWSAMLNTGKEISLDSSDFSYCVRLWGTGTSYFPTYHHNQVSGGGGEASAWNGVRETMQTATYKHRYKNYIQDTNSIFNPTRVTREEAKNEGLIPYPKVIGNTQEPLCVSSALEYVFPAHEQMMYRRLNATLGKSRQVHFFVLLFPSVKGVDVSFRQRQYWEGGNKNEFTICLGVEKNEADALTVTWCKPFSWMDAPTLEVAVQGWFLEHPTLDMPALATFLEENIDLWKRKQFSDFKYLGRHLSSGRSILYILSTLAVCAACIAILLEAL